ncbi:hypothetical protein ACHHYP_17374 [Achlya hypogyna]|uniref:Ricin B lectin domain-containing protein n=1 Tax=Achlya hypogyna TaxID=1202772 RepID=A0A1V9Y4K3_ACHHY|nr:hypothetical protein ACHHYP_17374 [Achlya hypogyna]
MIPGVDLRICSSSNTVLSEGYGSIYSDIVRNTANEHFTWDAADKMLQSVVSGLCLDAYAVGNTFAVHGYACDSNNANQKWNVDLTNRVISHATHSGWCLANNPLLPGQKATMARCDAAQSAQKFHNCDDNSVEPTVNVGFAQCTTGKYLSEYNTGLFVNYVQHNLNEQFTYNPTTQQLKVASNGQCLDAYLDGNNVYQLHTYPCDSNNVNQRWNLGSSKIQHAIHPNLCVTSTASADNSAGVAPCNGRWKQCFNSIYASYNNY